MKRQRQFLIPGALLAVALLWSGTTLLTDAHAALRALRGGDECDCTSCEDYGPQETDECLHTSSPPDPSGGLPVPDPHDPNAMWDPNNNACSPDYCIRNSDYFARCAVMAGGPECPMHDHNDTYALRQELFDDAPPECLDPNYAEVNLERECWGISGSAWCVVDSCGSGVKLDPAVYQYAEYRGGSDNDPNVGRKVCD